LTRGEVVGQHPVDFLGHPTVEGAKTRFHRGRQGCGAWRRRGTAARVEFVIGLNRLAQTALERKNTYAVYPFFCFGRGPNQDQIAHHQWCGQRLWNQYQARACLASHELCEMSRHCPPVVSDQHSAIVCGPGQHLRITHAAQACGSCRSKIDGRFLPYRRQKDDEVEIGISLKPDFHRGTRSSLRPP